MTSYETTLHLINYTLQFANCEERIRSLYLMNDIKNKKFFFLISKVLSFRHTKQTSKNVSETLKKEVIKIWRESPRGI